MDNQANETTIKAYEDALLGFIILKPDPRMLDVREILPTADYFSDPTNRGLYRAFMEFTDKDAFPGDPALTIRELYRFMQSTPKCGFHFRDIDDLTRYISGLIKDFEMFDPTKYKEYAAQIRWEKDKGALKEIAQSVIAGADNVPYSDREEYLSTVESKLGNITLSIRENKGLLHISEATNASIQRIERMHRGEQMSTGLKTGIHSLDRKLGGLNPGEIIVLAGGTGQGKTAFSLAIAENIAMHEKKSVMMFSLEMMDEQLTDRMLTRLAHVSMDTFNKEISKLNSKFYLNTYNKQFEDRMKEKLETQYWRLKTAYDFLNTLPIYQTTSGALSTSAIKSMILQKKRELEQERKPELGLVIIDYLQIIQPPEGMRNANRTDIVGDMSRKCKQIAKEAQVPILLLAQLNRNAETDEPPELKDLRESGSIEQDADKVIFLYGPNSKKTLESYAHLGDRDVQELAWQKERMHVMIRIAKNRQGESGVVDTVFDWEYQNFLSQSDQYSTGAETFEEFWNKYYQKTRSGADIFWPLTSEDMIPGMEKYRTTAFPEKQYLDSNNVIVKDVEEFKGNPLMNTTSGNSIVYSKTKEEEIIDDFVEDFEDFEEETQAFDEDADFGEYEGEFSQEYSDEEIEKVAEGITDTTEPEPNEPSIAEDDDEEMDAMALLEALQDELE